ncbi:MAG: tetratricopeptide repeat protein [Verrucomicrobiia bacterium]
MGWVLLWLSFSALPAMAQSPSSLGTTRLQEVASQYLDRSAFAAAVPYLHELNRRLRESEDSAAIRARESILFYLGLGRLQAAELPLAAVTLAEFISLYPDSPHASSARLYQGDAYYYQGRLADARSLYAEMEQQGDPSRLTSELRLLFWEHYADSVYAERDWAAGLPVFAQFSDALTASLGRLGVDEKRAKASSYKLQAAMALDNFEAAMAILPELSGRTGKSRYDVALNLALMRGGDGLYEAQRFGEALFFYELVIRPAALKAFWAEQIGQLQMERARIADVEWFADRLIQLDNDLAQARTRITQLSPVEKGDGGNSENRVPDFSAALNFRIARCYMARGRSHEAFWAFHRLESELATAKTAATGGFAEESLYGQVKMAAAAGRSDRIQRLARRYLRTADYGRFIGDVAYELLQTEVQTGNLPAVRELAGAYLDRVRLDPTLQEAPKLIYLVGSTLMEGSDASGLSEGFGPMLHEYPDRGFSDGLHYWLGLADVLEGRFRPALDHFSTIAADYPNGSYTEDVEYRMGVCWFGLLDYAKAKLQLEGFLADYPDSRLVSEAHALLGDLAGAEGRVEAAIDAYAMAQETGGWLNPPNMGYINHAVFQAGELFAQQQRWIEMAEWFEFYLKRWGKQGRAGDALYQLGRAQVALGRNEAMLELWIQSILEFGNDPADTGPDLMLAEFPEHFEAVRGQSPVAVLRDSLAIARAQQHETLQLRMGLALELLGEPVDQLPHVSLDNIAAASGAVLLATVDRERVVNPELALVAAERVLDLNPWGLFAADAWKAVAELSAAGGDTMKAIGAWRHLAENFPTSAHASVARLREGDMQRQRGAHTAAITAYREVLKVRQWRGEAWAEANYKIGLTHFESGDYSAAFGFCQRVYVLYGGVERWAAEAYLTSGLSLEALDRTSDAVATYEELLSTESLRDESAAKAAAERLEALRLS